MGHFSHSCKLSGLPITGGSPAALIVMKLRDSLYDNSEKNLRKFGQSHLISNDSTQVKFTPLWFPIHGQYDEYGGLENIIEDDNSKILEDYYGLPIQDIVNVITSGRKDDGYDGNLKVIKVEPVLPDDFKKGEDWFKYYQRTMNDPMPFDGRYPDVSGKYNDDWKEDGYEGWTVSDGSNGKRKATKEEYDAAFKLIHEHYARYKEWCNDNPDPLDDYRNPNYKERYKELVTYSAMWVHGEFYNRLTETNNQDDYDKIDLGNPELLNALGFEEVPSDDKKKKGEQRYNRKFQKDNLVIYSDGNWMTLKDDTDGVYTLHQFKKYCKKHGVDIDIENINKKDRVEQIYDYLIPTMKITNKREYNQDTEDKLDKALEMMGVSDEDDITDEQMKELANLFDENSPIIPQIDNDHYMKDAVQRILLNEDRYKITNPLTMPYFKAAKSGKLRDNIIRFWRFDRYMFVTGSYYDIIGTAPQDGEAKDVLKFLTIAKDVLEKEIQENKERWGDDNEEE